MKSLTKEQRSFISANYGKLKQYEIAKELKVSPACVSLYVRGKRGTPALRRACLRRLMNDPDIIILTREQYNELVKITPKK